MKQPVFTRQKDNTVRVDAFTLSLLVSRELFREGAQGILVRVGFREFEIRCANGTQRYRAVRRGRWPRTYEIECHVVGQFFASGRDTKPVVGMRLWPDDDGLQPRDGSWGYVVHADGVREHVQHGDWIVPDRNGYRIRR